MVFGNAGRCARCLAILVAGTVAAMQGRECLSQYEPAQLNALSRTGGQVGTSFDVRLLAGNQLAEAKSLHFSSPAISSELKTRDPLPFTQERTADYGHFVVTIPDNVAPGRYEVQVAGRHGVSNPRAFLVTRLPNEVPGSVSHDAAAPTPLAIGTLLHSKSSNAEVDFFRINLAKDQPLQIELFAQRLDSRMLGQIRLFDAQGQEVVSARGADDVDPVLQTPADLPAGDYVVAVHDFLFRGGDEYHYQILARPLDQADALIPSTDARDGRLPETWATSSVSLRNRYRLDSFSHANYPPGQPIAVELPLETVDWFPANQRDAVFQFSATEGDQWFIDVVSQRAGEPSDARVMVHRIEDPSQPEPKLQEVLAIDDSQNISDGAVTLFSTDPVAMFNAPATAQYQLAVRDLDVGDSLSPNQSFQLHVRSPEPGFDLVAYRPFSHRDLNQTQPSGSHLFRGGSELIRVFVIRRDGWNGAVKVRCEGLPPGVISGEAVVAPNQTQTQLVLTAAEDSEDACAPFRVVGRSEDGSMEQEATAATIQWGKGAGRDFIQSRASTALWLSVSQLDIAPLSLSVGDGNAVEIKKGQSLKLPVKLVRREGGKAACVFRARDLPGGVSVPELTVAAENSEGEIEIKAEPNATPGTYSLWLQVETKIKYRPNPQGLERAQQYRSHLQSLHDDPAQAEHLDAIKAAIAEADKLVEAAKGAANEKELTVFLPTPNATIRIVEP